MAAAVLFVAACGGDDDSTDAVDTTIVAETTDATPTTESSVTTVPDTTEAPVTTAAADSTVPDSTESPATTAASDTTSAGDTTPAGEPTAPGTALTYGDAAVVAIDDERPDELLELVVRAPEQGTPAELEELQVPDVAPGSTLHYVTLDITNVSAEPVGGEYQPSTSRQLLVLQDDGEPAQPIINFVAFEPCDEEDPDDVAVGESFTTCLTYLAAPDTTITSIVFAATFSDEPIVWS